MSGIALQAQTALDNVDFDKMFVNSWYANSSSMNALKDAKVRDEERDARAEAQAKQQQIENIPALADATQKLSGATDPSSIVAQAGGQ